MTQLSDNVRLLERREAYLDVEQRTGVGSQLMPATRTPRLPAWSVRKMLFNAVTEGVTNSHCRCLSVVGILG